MKRLKLRHIIVLHLILTLTFFSIEKWLRYCSLDNLYLEFSFKGNIQINLIGLDYRHTFYQYEQDLHQEILSSDKEKHHKIRIDQFNMQKSALCKC